MFFKQLEVQSDLAIRAFLDITPVINQLKRCQPNKNLKNFHHKVSRNGTLSGILISSFFRNVSMNKEGTYI